MRHADMLSRPSVSDQVEQRVKVVDGVQWRSHSGVQRLFVAFDVDVDDTCCARGQCVETGEDAIGAGLRPDAAFGVGDDDGSEMVRAEQGKLTFAIIT